MCGARDDVDDASANAARVRRLSAHRAHGVPGEIRSTEKIDLERTAPTRAPRGEIVAIERVFSEDTGVIDQRVDASEARQRPIEQARERLGLGQIVAFESHPRAFAAARRRERLRRVAITRVGKVHRRLRGVQRTYDRSADTPGSTRHENDSVRHVAHHARWTSAIPPAMAVSPAMSCTPTGSCCSTAAMASPKAGVR